MSQEESRKNDVKTLVDQLREGNKLAKKIDRGEFNLEPEDLQKFILNNTGKLIQDSMDTIDNIKQFIISAPEPEDVHSLAELYKASTGALETLNKIYLQQNKSETTIKVKTMDIQAKMSLAEDKENKITFTREEIFDKLIKSGDVIEAESADVDDA